MSGTGFSADMLAYVHCARVRHIYTVMWSRHILVPWSRINLQAGLPGQQHLLAGLHMAGTNTMRTGMNVYVCMHALNCATSALSVCAETRALLLLCAAQADWDIVKRGWQAHVLGKAPHTFTDPVQAVKTLRVRTQEQRQQQEQEDYMRVFGAAAAASMLAATAAAAAALAALGRQMHVAYRMAVMLGWLAG